MINLKNIKKIHFTGIKGVGMTALALCAKDLGMEISGSDIKEYFVTDKTLKKAKISWKIGFSRNHIKDPDLVVFTAAHGGEENIEVLEAKKRKIPVLSHGRALGLFMKEKIGISVCGVGGKTTTAAMIATVFHAVGLNPSFAVGAASIDPLGLPGRYNKTGRYFVAEADEYYASPQDLTPRFLYQSPKVIVITNIEFDHPDVYKNLNQTIRTFQKFVQRLPRNGLVVACLDSPNIKKILRLIKVPVKTYGFSSKADFCISLINQTRDKMIFSLKYKNKYINNIFLSVPGEFNVKNATAAYIVCKFFNIAEKTIKKGLMSFKGTKRRFEFVCKAKGIIFFDDYAHHPLQIEETLKAAKAWFKNKRIIAIFQPHTYSRTKALFSDFQKSFSSASKVYLVPIYASAREKKDVSVSSKKLAWAIKKTNTNTVYVKNKNQLIKKLKKDLKPGDVVFTLGAGDIFTWNASIAKAIESD